MTNVAETILKQLGGNRFLTMTGAKNLTKTDNSLTMRLPGTKANCVRITLTGMDDYQIEAMNVRGVKLKPIAFREGVYVDQLQDIFTELTGLYTKL